MCFAIRCGNDAVPCVPSGEMTMIETRIRLRDDLFRIRRSAKASPAAFSADLPKPSRRMDENVPKAFCASCKEWCPMEWLPPAERGRRCEEWFRCAVCGGRRLTIRYG